MVITSVEISTTKGNVKDWGIAGLGDIGGDISVASASCTRGIRNRKTRRCSASGKW